MVNQFDEIRLSQMVHFGFTELQARVYVANYVLGEASAKQIREICKMHKAEVYRVLKELQDMRITDQIIAHPVRYRARCPAEVLKSLLLPSIRKMSALSDTKGELLEWFGTLRPAENVWKQDGDGFEVLHDHLAVERVKDMFLRASSYIYYSGRYEDKARLEVIDAFNKARAANRAWMQVVEKTPALQAVREGVEPDKFIQKFLVGSGNESTNKAVFNLSQQIKKDPEAVTAVKGAITNYLKTKALSGATDEVGNFSQSAYNKTISSIGERKLAMFFSPVEVQQLKAIGRVASYEQVQPSGSAVNNSNTATTLIGFLDRIGRKIPGVSELILDPVKGVATNIRASRSLNAPKSLLTKQPEARKLPPVLLPLFIEQQADN